MIWFRNLMFHTQNPTEIQLLNWNKPQYCWVCPTGDAKLRLKYYYLNKEQIKSWRIFNFSCTSWGQQGSVTEQTSPISTPANRHQQLGSGAFWSPVKWKNNRWTAAFSLPQSLGLNNCHRKYSKRCLLRGADSVLMVFLLPKKKPTKKKP